MIFAANAIHIVFLLLFFSKNFVLKLKRNNLFPHLLFPPQPFPIYIHIYIYRIKREKERTICKQIYNYKSKGFLELLICFSIITKTNELAAYLLKLFFWKKKEGCNRQIGILLTIERLWLYSSPPIRKIKHTRFANIVFLLHTKILLIYNELFE